MFLTSWPSYAPPFPSPAELFLRTFNEGNPRHDHAVSAAEVEDGWELSAEIPGCSVEDVKIEVKGDTVTIHAAAKTPPPAGWALVRRERPEVEFTEHFRFFKPIDVDHVEAAVKDGVLTVKVPRLAPPAARVIPVASH